MKKVMFRSVLAFVLFIICVFCGLLVFDVIFGIGSALYAVEPIILNHPQREVLFEALQVFMFFGIIIGVSVVLCFEFFLLIGKDLFSKA